METNSTITIHGELSEVFGYAAAIERWPEILSHYRSVQILEESGRDRLVKMHCVRAFGIIRWPCIWRARQEVHQEDGRILFCHVSGPARGMKVEWKVENVCDGVKATIRHWTTGPGGPLSRVYWDRIVGPIFIRSIAEQTLAGIKKRVEGEASK